jgi:hypothetical protein
MQALPVSDTREREARGSGGFGPAHAGAREKQESGSVRPNSERGEE